MKSYALELALSKTGFNARLNTMREYLQAYILRFLHDEGVFRRTAFLGGTALRFIYGIPRFSEDLDFSVVKKEGFDFVDTIRRLKGELESAGYDVAAAHSVDKTVWSALIKFTGLMYEAGISPHRNQVFSIKIEVDSNPPDGAVLKTDIVNRYFPIAFLSYDLESLFAGKLHALLSRKYTKGRDFFDLGWYLSRWRDIAPNFILLHNALKQTGWTKKIPSAQDWRECLRGVVESADWKKVNEDVTNFLENPSDVKVFTRENVLKLVTGQ